MYPLSTRANFAADQWYVAAWSDEISRTPLSRRILDTPVVFYRTEDGTATAMIDMCPHRRYPLSRGKVIGDRIQCQYHGFGFAADGACVRIPAQNSVPSQYRVRTFAVVEKWDWVWIWMGDQDLADPALIPDHAPLRVEDEGWTATRGGLGHVGARYTLIHENLLDLSHLSFLHENTIGSDSVAQTNMKVEQKDGYLEVTRNIVSVPAESFPVSKILEMSGLVDRTMAQQFFPPGLHIAGSDFASSGAGGHTPGLEYGSTRVIHAITPETAHSAHYFWAFSRNFLTDDEEVSAMIHRLTLSALEEDFVALEAIERNLSPTSNPADDIHCRADTAAVRGRRIIEQLIEREEARQQD